MSTDSSGKRKLSWITLLSFIMAVLPAVLDLLNSGANSASIVLKFNPDSQKLKASLTAEEGTSVTRTISNKG